MTSVVGRSLHVWNVIMSVRIKAVGELLVLNCRLVLDLCLIISLVHLEYFRMSEEANIYLHRYYRTVTVKQNVYKKCFIYLKEKGHCKISQSDSQ